MNCPGGPSFDPGCVQEFASASHFGMGFYWMACFSPTVQKHTLL